MSLKHAGEEVAAGVFRFGDGHVNWFLVEQRGAFTVIDGGMPNHWTALQQWLGRHGHAWSAIEAIVLTHGHPDHMGITQRLADRTRLPVHIHPADAPRAKGQGLQKIPRRIKRNLWRPSMLKVMASWGSSGLFTVPPIVTSRDVTDGETLDIPGRPRAIHTPGHSPGSTCFLLDGDGPLVVGDAMATLDVVTGRPGLGIMPGLLNDDPREALASISLLAGLPSRVLLPGHGEPWVGDLDEALLTARRAGIDWRLPPSGAHGHSH